MVKILSLECPLLIHLQRLVCICKMDTHIDYRLPSTHTVVVLFKFMILKSGVPTVDHTVLRCASLCQCVLAVCQSKITIFHVSQNRIVQCYLNRGGLVYIFSFPSRSYHLVFIINFFICTIIYFLHQYEC